MDSLEFMCCIEDDAGVAFFLADSSQHLTVARCFWTLSFHTHHRAHLQINCYFSRRLCFLGTRFFLPFRRCLFHTLVLLIIECLFLQVPVSISHHYIWMFSHDVSFLWRALLPRDAANVPPVRLGIVAFRLRNFSSRPRHVSSTSRIPTSSAHVLFSVPSPRIQILRARDMRQVPPLLPPEKKLPTVGRRSPPSEKKLPRGRRGEASRGEERVCVGGRGCRWRWRNGRVWGSWGAVPGGKARTVQEKTRGGGGGRLEASRSFDAARHEARGETGMATSQPAAATRRTEETAIATKETKLTKIRKKEKKKRTEAMA